MEIVLADNAARIGQIRALFEEYWAEFGFTPCFQNFSHEVANLPGDYAPPGGRLFLALVRGEPAGCGALRRLDAERVEAKRLYVRPKFRCQGIGHALLDWAITEARCSGYREIVGDTMPVMQRALDMYERLGFERTGPYSLEPTPGAIYLRFRL